MTFLREVKEVNMTEVGPVFKQWTDKIDRKIDTYDASICGAERTVVGLPAFRLGFYELFSMMLSLLRPLKSP